MKQAVANIPKRKIKIVDDLLKLINEKKTILIADISNIPGSQFQQITKKLRGKAEVKVPKKNLFFRALEKSSKNHVKDLEKYINGAVAILFSDLDSYELAAELLKNKSPAKAKAGQIAPNDLEVPAGPTELTPGPAISELGALGIQIMIKDGKIEIKEPKVVAEAGKPISQGAADILSKLNIMPFSIGFTPVSAFDSVANKLYDKIEIDTDKAREALVDAYARALPFAVAIGYITADTVRLMIQKAGAEEAKMLRIINGEPEEVEEAPAQTQDAAPAQEETKEEKEEPKTDFAASFF